ncbi:hypothetical protein [Hymenobacter sp. BT559]|uniref:hypothetical protein n=1 Tax=Hymenobacter sp. BT559 TaxID=2795729 RepID=UPI0018EC7C45|nr:hypothetical protein [Hymenobacter sp. BT559]MBJ6142098.1 hypothetical protein [Hymenobacter sp. BT559]
MQKIFLTLLCSLAAGPVAWACPWCRPRVQAGIYTPAYTTNVLLVLLPIAVLLALGVALFYWDKLRPYFFASYGKS